MPGIHRYGPMPCGLRSARSGRAPEPLQREQDTRPQTDQARPTGTVGKRRQDGANNDLSHGQRFLRAWAPRNASVRQARVET